LILGIAGGDLDGRLMGGMLYDVEIPTRLSTDCADSASTSPSRGGDKSERAMDSALYEVDFGRGMGGTP